MTNPERPYFVPVVLGTPRAGRMSLPVANLMVAELAKRPGVETELIDVARMRLPVDGAGEAIKDPAFAARMTRADALVVVSPEYNHGYSGLLKHLLDTCLKEYVHKAVGIVGVSAGPWGGTRGIQDLLPVMRELGLVTIFWDVNFANVQSVFDASGALRDQGYVLRIAKFLDELAWMARTLRRGREAEEVAPVPAMTCPSCAETMNHHADKVVQTAEGDPALGGAVQEMHACRGCGAVATRPAAA